MTIFFVSIFGVYYLLTILLIVGLHRSVEKNLPERLDIPYSHISIVVAFKNEESNLLSLIQSLAAQNYPKNFFEVVLVDDHSNDQSPLIVMNAIRELSNFRLILNGFADAGKKKAITKGVRTARFQIIATTDADCIVPPNWLKRINETFYEEPALAFGGVKILEKSSFFSKLQVMEFSSLIGSGAATHCLGVPSMCNAANLVFSKACFNKVGGYKGNLEIASGDDEFLMRKMLVNYPHGVVFMPNQDAIVSTQPQATLAEFISQRLRWASKLPHNPSWSTKLLGWYIILFQSSYLLLLVLAFTNSISLELLLSLFAGKLLLEFIFLKQSSSFLQTKWSFTSLFALQFLYPLYTVYVGVASNFISYRWKGRYYPSWIWQSIKV
jgi:poly-beta-1,6-N-acetyl-D-glucosamine synthase